MVGYYCLEGIEIEIVCLVGIFFLYVGKLKEEDCLNCIVGYYCLLLGVIEVLFLCL